VQPKFSPIQNKTGRFEFLISVFASHHFVYEKIPGSSLKTIRLPLSLAGYTGCKRGEKWHFRLKYFEGNSQPPAFLIGTVNHLQPGTLLLATQEIPSPVGIPP
jgi:hypothetical protein